jgi:CrcB protein
MEKVPMSDPSTGALVFVGGGGGSVIRWLVGLAVGERYKGVRFPLGTMLINVSGAFLMGFLSTLFKVDWRDRHGSNLTAFVLTGVLGGYTTFSSYQLDTANLYNKGGRGWALYWAGPVAAGLIAATLGAMTAKLFG